MILTTNDPLTDEQIKKRAIGIEDVDINGLVKRHRVLGQTLFDMLFLKEFIDQAQYEAAHLFIDAMAKSGAVIRSANLDTEIFTPHREVGNIIGERRLAFSSAYRAMVKDVGLEMANLTMRYFADVYSYPTQNKDQVRVSRTIKTALSSLARHYGTVGIEDPRRIIRRFSARGVKT